MSKSKTIAVIATVLAAAVIILGIKYCVDLYYANVLTIAIEKDDVQKVEKLMKNPLVNINASPTINEYLSIMIESYKPSIPPPSGGTNL